MLLPSKVKKSFLLFVIGLKESERKEAHLSKKILTTYTDHLLTNSGSNYKQVTAVAFVKKLHEQESNV